MLIDWKLVQPRIPEWAFFAMSDIGEGKSGSDKDNPSADKTGCSRPRNSATRRYRGIVAAGFVP
jgi:hypothetical protein